MDDLISLEISELGLFFYPRITYMWDVEKLGITLVDVEGATSLVRITTPVGIIEILGEITLTASTLKIDRAHIDGPGAGMLGRIGLNAIGSKILEEADVEEVIIQGGTRTTGCNPGRPPKAIRFPRRSHAQP